MRNASMSNFMKTHSFLFLLMNERYQGTNVPGVEVPDALRGAVQNGSE